MNNIQAAQEEVGETPAPRPESQVVLVRLMRLRRDEERQLPSCITAQLVGKRFGRAVQVTSHADLTLDGRHLLLPKVAWEAGEFLIESVLREAPTINDSDDIESYIDSMIDSIYVDFVRESSKRTELSFPVIARAVRAAFLGFVRDEGSATEQDNGLPEWDIRRISRYAVAPAPSAPKNMGNYSNTFEDAPYIEPLPKDGTKGFLLEREALRYGMSSVRYPNGAFVITSPKGEELGFKWGRSPLASGVALSICSYKEATRRILQRMDVSVPRGRVFSVSDSEQATEFADRIGYPVVCKPVAGLRGIGVIANIQNRQALEEALILYQQSELGNDDFVIEEHVPGEDYRIVVIGDEVVASVVRAPASVTGNGFHCVLDLIEYKNRARKKNPHLSSRLIRITDALEYQLRIAGLSYSSVPAPNEVITLANSANLTQGGDSFEVGNELHPSIKELAVKAVQSVPGLGFCGLDMLIEDHRKPTWEQKVTVIELNAHAAIGSAQYPMWGTPYPVAKRFFEATATKAGIALPGEQATSLSLKLEIRGRVTGVGYRKWFRRKAENFGLTGYVKNLSQRRVDACVQGSADAASAIAYLAMEGPDRAVVSSVAMSHIEEHPGEGFEIR
jgi:D-alanine-D-alanine ligase-like ATP-grasp enzyme/acylphosphatase